MARPKLHALQNDVGRAERGRQHQADEAVDAEHRQRVLGVRQQGDERGADDGDDRDGPAGAGEIIEARDAPASAIHARPPEHQHRHRRERRGQVEHGMADQGEAPVVRFQPDDQICGGDREDGVDVDDEHAALDGRHRVDLEDRPAPEEGKLVVAEPVHTDEAGEQQRHDDERGIAGGQEHGNERRAGEHETRSVQNQHRPAVIDAQGQQAVVNVVAVRHEHAAGVVSRAVPAFGGPWR